MNASPMPSAEVAVTLDLVRRLVGEQMPDLAGRQLRMLAHGWDNVMVRIGDDLVARLPRRTVAVELLLHEQRWLPELAPRLPLPIPVPVRAGLWVAGVSDTRHRSADLEAALRDAPQDAALVLATHDPDVFPDVPERVALTVAGHLHGGQVNVPILRHAVLPSRFGDRYLAGHVVEHGRHLYVSTGLGTAGMPVRLCRPPELPVLTLRARAPRTPAG